jgi:hypothetical protein
MKPIGVIAAVFSLIVAIALAAFGIVMRSRFSFLFSAICFLVAGYMWFLQRDVNKKISGRGKR